MKKNLNTETYNITFGSTLSSQKDQILLQLLVHTRMKRRPRVGYLRKAFIEGMTSIRMQRGREGVPSRAVTETMLQMFAQQRT